MIVSDASPLICLAKVEKLSLLRELFGRVVIEEEVKREAIVMGLKVRGSLYVLKKAVENGLISKDEAIKTLDEMIEDGFRISTRIYAKFLDEVKIY